MSRRSIAGVILGIVVLIIAAAMIVVALTRSAPSAARGGVQGVQTTPSPSARTPADANPTTPDASPTATPATPRLTDPSSTSSGGQPAGIAPGDQSGGGTSAASGLPSCMGTATAQKLSLPQTVYHSRETVIVTGSITNAGSSCVGAPTGFALAITDPANRVAAASRPGQVDQGALWPAGSTITETFAWSQANCATNPCQTAAAGGYVAGVTWARFQGLRQGFSIMTQCSPSDILLAANLPGYPANTYKASDPFSMSGTVTNTSRHSCDCAYTIEFRVTDSSGTMVFGAGMGPAMTGQSWSPGQSFAEASDAAHFDAWTPSTPGTYQVTISSPEFSLTVPPFTVKIN